MIAGTASGVGKTTIVCALLAALHRRGMRLQPFKVGPDYIDPSHHQAVCGRPSRSLDSVMLSESTMKRLFVRATAGAELAIIEGVMGLFDGRNNAGEQGSTAQIAKLLGAPVIVVLDVAKSGRSIGAVALGMAHFDLSLNLAGFVLNRVGSETHARVAVEAVESATGLPVLGVFPRDPELAIEERHLGLVPASGPAPLLVDRLAVSGERYLQIERILSIAGAAGAGRPPSLTLPLAGGRGQDEAATRARGRGQDAGLLGLVESADEASDPPLFPTDLVPTRAVLAIAQDEAFSFYYQDSLDLLEAWGADLVPFSPLRDPALPSGCQGVYLGGGFPELYAAELASNTPMLASLRAAADRGLPIYAECGGMMYLGRRLTDFEGRAHTMVGLVPAASIMTKSRSALGYRGATALRSSPILPAGVEVVGHEFHYSRLDGVLPESCAAYRLDDQDGRSEGYLRDQILASYLHLHLGSNPGMAPRFVAACAKVAQSLS